MTNIEISGYIPGAIGRIVELHATYYHEHWGFDLFFESKVAEGLSAFLNRLDPTHDGFWVAKVDGTIAGSIAIDGTKGDAEGAHLRWFIIDPAYQGLGLGNRLLTEAIDFCRSAKFHRVYLWTFSGLDAARFIYNKFGFSMCKELEAGQWGKTMREQMFELKL